jgi:exopolysaccharide biosynthesis polyprenyl glycosylphosphotransferase
LLVAVFKAVAVDFIVLTAAIFIVRIEDYPRNFLFLFAGLVFIFIIVQRLLVRLYTNKVSRKSFNTRKILLVGDLKRGRIVSDLMEHQLSWGHEVIGRLTTRAEEEIKDETIGRIEDLLNILRNQAVDEVIFALHGDRNVDLGRYLNICRKMGVPVRILPALWEPGGHALSVERCQDVPFLNMHMDNFNATGLLYKRILDILGGTIGFVIFLVLYPFVGLAIKLDSPGPVFFSQLRKGRHGRIFKLYKFRTMFENAEELKKELMGRNVMQGAMFKMADDPRMTHTGKWLRKTSLDEVPQFINVLKGEMSLVGTRPPTIDEVEKYQPEHLKRIAAKPGITGLWQVSGRNKITDFEKVVELDCKYLENWHFADDLKILFKTIWVVLQRKGAV